MRVMLSVCVFSQRQMDTSAELPSSFRSALVFVSFSSESVYWPSSVFTLPSQQVAQAHSRILNLELPCGVQVQTGLLAGPEVGYTVEPPADIMCSVQAEIADSLILLHLQLQDRSGLLSAHALVTHVHIKNVGSGAVDVDLVVVNQTHHIAAVRDGKLQRCIAGDVWSEIETQKTYLDCCETFHMSVKDKDQIRLMFLTHLARHQPVCVHYHLQGAVKKTQKLTLENLVALITPSFLNVTQCQRFFVCLKGHAARL